MSTSYEAHVTAMLENFAKAADERDFGEVDGFGTRWARVPVSGAGNLFDLARAKAQLNMPLVNEPDDART